MRKILPVLVIILLVPVGYFMVSHHGSNDSGPSSRENSINLNETLGPIVFFGPSAIQLDKRVYSSEDTLTLTIINRDNFTLTTGYDFRLYRLENDEWVEVKLNLSFPEVLIQIKPGESWEQKICLSKLKLKPGTYRIEKRVCSSGICGPHWAEFEVRG